MVHIHQISLSRSQLDSIPDAERRLLILIAHADNELNVLAKLFHFSARARSKTPILAQAENAQALILGRILTGKIFECWQLLDSAFFGTALSRTYVPKFDEEAAQALESVKRYFSRNNPITAVRNKHAFHYSLDEIDAGYRALVDGDPLEIYLSEANANTLYAFADTIAGRAMLETIKPADPQGAFETLIADTKKMVNLLNTVISQIMVTCIQTHLRDDLYSLGAKEIEIEGASDSQKVSIPYFVEIDAKHEA